MLSFTGTILTSSSESYEYPERVMTFNREQAGGLRIERGKLRLHCGR